MNLDIIYKHSECFQKKENSSNIKKVKYYNYSIKRHYRQDCSKLKKSQTLITIKWESEDVK